ncbi:TIGR02186 family protein [Candidatus Endowatersipora endosymbiont of Watersipora subatra]|uniref:TIGR02186 family protein n=1 Tax=Candidatus Endowatersipora endosymbiont of Watersipora subatra TaxID=3077946 RepID=UPI00312C82D6
MLQLISIMLISFIVQQNAHAIEDVQIGLSSESISITSSFSGTTISVFGLIENGNLYLLNNKGYDVIVALVGPIETIVVRRKQKKGGIWINGDSQIFTQVPASYSVATTRPLELAISAEEMKSLQIGFKKLSFQKEKNHESKENVLEFKESLIRLKARQNLYLENIGSVDFLSPSFFRAKLILPKTVPMGFHRAKAYLFRNGELVTSRSTFLHVKKIGFEQVIYDLAHQNSWLYGILCIGVAITTGWLASIVFRKD